MLKNLSTIITLALLLAGCAKDGLVVSPTATTAISPSTQLTISPIHPVLPQQPFQTFVNTYNVPPTSNNKIIELGVGWFDAQNGNESSYGNGFIGFAFRSSVAGNVNGLGLMMPYAGYSHTMTFWDSVTHAVLGTLNVTQTGTGFCYSQFPTPVAIQANHGYIVGYNTQATSIFGINTSLDGAAFYVVQGMYVDDFLGNDQPLLPFTEGNITVENGFSHDYYSGPLRGTFFPAAADWNAETNGYFGLADISFSPPL